MRRLIGVLAGVLLLCAATYAPVANYITFSGWTTGTRPASPAAGTVGFNTTVGNLDVYTGTGWVQPCWQTGGCAAIGPITATALTLSGAAALNGAGTGLAVASNETVGGSLSVAGATTAHAVSVTSLSDSGGATFAGSTSAPAVSVTNAAANETSSAIAATGIINYYLATQSVLVYTTAASGNWTLNVTGSVGTTLNSMLSVGQMTTVTFVAEQGATAYYSSTFEIDGSTSGISLNWLNGAAPSAGTINSYNAYTYNIIKTANSTYLVFANWVPYY